MNRRKFTKTITGSVVAALAIPLIVNAGQVKPQSKNAVAVEWIKGFEHGYEGCLNDIRRQTKFSSKKCFEYDGVMYIAGVSGRVL